MQGKVPSSGDQNGRWWSLCLSLSTFTSCCYIGHLMVLTDVLPSACFHFCPHTLPISFFFLISCLQFPQIYKRLHDYDLELQPRCLISEQFLFSCPLQDQCYSKCYLQTAEVWDYLLLLQKVQVCVQKLLQQFSIAGTLCCTV